MQEKYYIKKEKEMSDLTTMLGNPDPTNSDGDILPYIPDSDIPPMPPVVEPPPEPIAEPNLISPEERIIPTNVITIPQADIVEEEKKRKVNELLTIFHKSITRIQRNQKIDRAQVEEAITMVRGHIDNTIREEGKGVGTLLESYVKALEIKSSINTNANKSLDSIARLLAAAKNNEIVLNVDKGSKGELNLELLLSQPRRDDEL